MSGKPDKWFAVSAAVPPEYVEAAEEAFNELDALGTEVDLLTKSDEAARTVTAYFSEPPDESSVLDAILTAASIRELPAPPGLIVRQNEVIQQDWLAEWKKYWRPVRIGRFVIAAPWHEVEDLDGEFVIRIEPNMAFGTGTHETTQLCLAAIDAHFRPGWSCLDVGTGTGILAMAAAMISDTGERIAGIDNDPDAVLIARDNAAMNGLGSRIELSTGTLEDILGIFDLISANLTADVILPILPKLIERADKLLVLSGILAEQREMIAAALPAGTSHSITEAGEWIAIIIKQSD